MHLNLLYTVTLAGLTATALDIKGKATTRIAMTTCIGCFGKQITYLGKQTRIGGRIGARCAPNGALVNINDLIQMLYPLHAVVRTRIGCCAVQLVRKVGVKNTVDKRGFARA